jgi:hypothetical protein
MEIRPYNEGERTFSVIVLLLALVSFSSFVSTLTASITRITTMRGNEVRQFWLLRRYLRELRISRPLYLRVQRHCEYAWQRQSQTVQAQDVQLLSFLSTTLRDDIKAETFVRPLSLHPFIARVQHCVRNFVDALSVLDLAKGDLVFALGERASEMYCVIRGECAYWEGIDPEEAEPYVIGKHMDEDDTESNSSSSSKNSSDVSPVVEGDFVSEPALWTHWDHLGYMDAITVSQLADINAEAFVSVVRQSVSAWLACKQYARSFLFELNATSNMELSDVIDRALSHRAAAAAGELSLTTVRVGSSVASRIRDRRNGGVDEMVPNNMTSRMRQVAIRVARYC